jgi:hypothetical protein
MDAQKVLFIIGKILAKLEIEIINAKIAEPWFKQKMSQVVMDVPKVLFIIGQILEKLGTIPTSVGTVGYWFRVTVSQAAMGVLMVLFTIGQNCKITLQYLVLTGVL